MFVNISLASWQVVLPLFTLRADPTPFVTAIQTAVAAANVGAVGAGVDVPMVIVTHRVDAASRKAVVTRTAVGVAVKDDAVGAAASARVGPAKGSP